ncbi:MAG TPA: amino acid ABC transporter permease [Clostridia bacterium]|nr:MAG: L-cystine transport system permease protein TcyB [Firmicutes bacterium ADurb.Bin248]HOG01138.1 amino acid ABC transporter permease [Clostridia bacterium]HOS18017.1 amino acid ABC transporter permease [Clostridia bacterium]HPK16318.1 amino acid ABC transporter permease [Clostridia bacterium]
MAFGTMLLQLGGGMLVSVLIYVSTAVLAVPLALPLAFARMSKYRALRLPSAAYISFMRGTPLMLQILVVYFGPWYLLGIRIDFSYKLYAVIIAFALNYAAYFAEIYRAGIESIPIGQREAAQVLGYTKAQAFFRIVMPQVVKRILPPMTNEAITLIKDTSLAFAIGVMEMFTYARQIASAQKSMLPLAAAAAFYYIFNAAVAWLMGRFEKRLAYYR